MRSFRFSLNVRIESKCLVSESREGRKAEGMEGREGEGKGEERGRERERKGSSLHIIRATGEWPETIGSSTYGNRFFQGAVK